MSASGGGRGEMTIEVVPLGGGKSVSIEVQQWTTVQDVKRMLSGQGQGQRLFLRGVELINTRTMHDCNVMEGEVLYMAPERAGWELLGSMEVVRGSSCDPACSEMIEQVNAGFSRGFVPNLALDGTGGTYFLRDPRKQTVAVFKPRDEEPFTPHNPRGYVAPFRSHGLRQGFYSGEGAYREVAAYLIDGGRAGVPPTALVEASHSTFTGSPKVGSLQRYVASDESAGDWAPKVFSVTDVHSIALLDIRILNTDRNDNNLLVVRGGPSSSSGSKGLRLVPIDHGYCLPEQLEVLWADWVWLSWPQAIVPFDDATLAFIASIDVEADIRRLAREVPLQAAAYDNMRVAARVLQAGAKAGLTLRGIASLICRSDVGIMSDVEYTVVQARVLSLRKGQSKRNREPRSASHFMIRRVYTPSSGPPPQFADLVEDGGEADVEKDSHVRQQSLDLYCAQDNSGNALPSAVSEEGRAFWEYFDQLLAAAIERTATKGARTDSPHSDSW